MKLKEKDSAFGSLGRVMEVTDEHGKAILAGQEKSGIVLWEKAADKDKVTDDLTKGGVPVPTHLIGVELGQVADQPAPTLAGGIVEETVMAPKAKQ